MVIQLDAVCSQVDLAEQIFHEGVGRGFYAKVSRLGSQWLELDLHFLSLGGGETALRWWFEKCLVPYLGDSKELATVKSIDIVTGYGKTRARGARKGDDSMRKRVRAMLSFMNVCEVVQPNLGRIHIDKQAFVKEVERNCGRIIFDANGYEQFKIQEGLDEPHSDAPQFVRPRGGALHDRGERDRPQGSLSRFPHDRVDHNIQQQLRNGKRYNKVVGSRGSPSCYDWRDGSCTSGAMNWQNHPILQNYQSGPPTNTDRNYSIPSIDIEERNYSHVEWQRRKPNHRFEPPVRHRHPSLSGAEREYNSIRTSPSRNAQPHFFPHERKPPTDIVDSVCSHKHLNDHHHTFSQDNHVERSFRNRKRKKGE